MWTYFMLSTRSSGSGRLDCLHILATADYAAMNICVCLCVDIFSILSGRFLETELLGYMVYLNLTF